MSFIKHISSTQSDEELVAAYRSTGQLTVLSDLYQRYMDLVYGVCLKYLHDPEDARDAVFNIFEELILKLKNHEVTYFKAWLYQVSRNHCLMHLRNKKKMPTTNDTAFVQLEDSSHLQDVLDKEANINQLQDCISKLVPQQKESIDLFYLQGKCYKEIAETTGIDINKIKSFIQNGRRNLKICMEKKALESA